MDDAAARGTSRLTGRAPSATPTNSSGVEIHDGLDTAASTSPVATVIRAASRIDVPAASVDVARAGMARRAGSERDHALALLSAKYAQYREQPPPGPVLAVAITRWHAWNAGGFG